MAEHSTTAYGACATGIHVCGISTTDYDEFVTIGNFPMDEKRARATFDRAKNLLAMPDDEDPDVIVDLMIGRDRVDDFGMRRQMLDALKREAESNAR